MNCEIVVEQLEKVVGTNTCIMNINDQQRHLCATGGKENELKVWDLQNPDNVAVFAAKNVSVFFV